VNVTYTANDSSFEAAGEITINVHGAAPDSVLFVRFGSDTGLPNGQQADGICQRAAAGVFFGIGLYPGGPPATVETSPGGAGAVHIKFGANNPFLPDGATVDSMLRLVDSLTSPTVDLRTACHTQTVK
jgi:hypothetical protein